jgi:hypothetical protein
MQHWHANGPIKTPNPKDDETETGVEADLYALYQPRKYPGISTPGYVCRRLPQTIRPDDI